MPGGLEVGGWDVAAGRFDAMVAVPVARRKRGDLKLSLPRLLRAHRVGRGDRRRGTASTDRHRRGLGGAASRSRASGPADGALVVPGRGPPRTPPGLVEGAAAGDPRLAAGVERGGLVVARVWPLVSALIDPAGRVIGRDRPKNQPDTEPRCYARGSGYRAGDLPAHTVAHPPDPGHTSQREPRPRRTRTHGADTRNHPANPITPRSAATTDPRLAANART